MGALARLPSALQIHETPRDFSRGVLRGGRDLKLCGNAGPTGTQRDAASSFALLEVAVDTLKGRSGPQRPGDCHSVTDAQAELIAAILACARERWCADRDLGALSALLLRLVAVLDCAEGGGVRADSPGR